MSSRKVHIQKPCAHTGCDRPARWVFNSNAEYLRSHEFRVYEKERQPYLCAKHSRGAGILSPTNLKTVWISPPSRPLENHPSNPYRSFGSAGIIFGEGFCAEGCDFPIGTRIKVTAEVLLPPESEV